MSLEDFEHFAVLMERVAKGKSAVLPINDADVEEVLEEIEYLEAELRTPVNNIEYFPPNFEGLVLGCIDADFCK